MLGALWHDFLYQPVFNLLIWLYNNWTNQNLGWAVIYLTILLRFILLPFTLVTEKNKMDNEQLAEEIGRVDKQLHSDPIIKKEEIRRILKRRRVSPWAKLIVLSMQGLVLVLLYQVFLRGITGQKVIQILYPSVQFPGKINTMFYGFDLAEPYTIIFPGLVGVLLLFEIYLSYRQRKGNLTKADLMYFILFPTAICIALWVLPMVKALFVLTSMAFSVVIHGCSRLVLRPKKKHKSV